MSQKSIVLVVILFILLVVGMFMFAYLKKGEIAAPTADQTPTEVPDAVPYPQVTRIEAKHFFIDGVHTVAGEIILPTPCDLLEAEVMVQESFPEQAIIDFTVINNAEVCAQQETAQRFKVDFAASPEATIVGRFMGREIVLNLIPAAPGELPEDFEVFIKG